jgi:CubicO group peptidase (beta-lactamase class C family)
MSTDDPDFSRGSRLLPGLGDRLARLHPRLGMLRFEEAIRRTTPDLMQRHGVPGMQFSFSIGGRAIRTVTFGVADAQLGNRLESSTVFALGSITKVLTALGALTLVRDGVMELDEPLDDEIGEFFNHAGREDLERLRKVTLRRLLGHATGLAHANPPRREQARREEWLAGDSLRFERDPGTGTGYSGMNYALVEVVLERRGGSDFAGLMRKRVFEPLGLGEMRFERELTGNETRASDHDERGEVVKVAPSVCAAASGLVSSTRNVCRCLQACHFEGKLLPLELMQLQLQPQPETLSGATATLGMHLHRGNDARSVSHGGTRPGHRSLVVVVPGAQGILCVAANSESGHEVFRPITGFFRAITMEE